MQQLPHGLGWGMPPGGPPPKKSKAAWIAVPIIVVLAGIVVLWIVGVVAKQNRLSDYSGPEPSSSSTASPSYEPSAEPSPVGPATSRPPTSKPVVKPTAPRTSNPPEPRRGPTDYEVVSRSALYRVGTMPATGCKESKARPSNTAGARANYAQLKACLGRAWPALVQRSGNQFRQPTVLTFTGRVMSPCGSMTDTGPPFYCGSNETIYMNLREDIGNYNQYPQSSAKVWARMWMLHQFAHEYGHHVQNLTGVLKANHDLRYDAPSRAAELELTRRLELQASCFSDVFIGANKASYPVTGAALREWRWLIVHVTDNANDHGDANNHQYWATRGFNSRNPAACNTFTAPSARVR